jgi:hypothetical protein
VLDGQQRVTSLFYVLYEPLIPLKNTKNPYRFFFRLDLVLDGDPTDAVVGISLADKRRMAEMERLVKQDKAIAFSMMKDPSQFYQWLYNRQQFLKEEEKRKVIESFYRRLERFMVPVVALSRETGKDNIVNIFERINRTGVTLSLFDLAVARLYLKEVRLRELWDDFNSKNKDMTDIVKPEFLLKVIALWEGKEPKRSILLDVIDLLDKTRFESRWNIATRFVSDAFKRISAAQGGYGAFHYNWIPYTTLIVPLAALLHLIEQQKGGETFYRKLDKWYWANVFTQRYDSAVDTKTYDDVQKMTKWFNGEEEPEWLKNVSVDSIDVDVDEPRSALYRGIMCLVVLTGARDFINGQAANLNECEDDHIFPRSKYGKRSSINSILNRTLISRSSNLLKKDKKPSEYLPVFLKNHDNDENRLRRTLETHMISDEAYEAMKRDDFESFIKARRLTIVKQIQRRLGIGSS